MTCAGSGWMDGWMGGWVDGWMGGWVDGWMGGWVDGWMLLKRMVTWAGSMAADMMRTCSSCPCHPPQPADGESKQQQHAGQHVRPRPWCRPGTSVWQHIRHTN